MRKTTRALLGPVASVVVDKTKAHSTEKAATPSQSTDLETLQPYQLPDGSWLLKGHGTTIQFDGQWVTIHKSYLAGGGLRAMGDRRIHVSQITGIEDKPGFLTITTADSPDRRAWGNMAKDPNSIQKPMGGKKHFAAIARLIQQAIAAGASPVAMPLAVVDPADQLRKLGELHDTGVLTDDEFAAKKTDLLDRM